jgi:AraC-like DNA-binding protein
MVSERLNQERDFDVLGDILETLRFRGSIFFRSDLAAPWGMSLSEIGIPRFHIVLSGACYVGSDGHESVKAEEADIIMLPNGDSHWIADQVGRELVPSSRAGKACELGNPLFQKAEITNRLMCGMVRFDDGLTHPILDALPEMMHFSMLESAGPIWTVVNLIDAEMQGPQEGGSRIADRLTEVLFLQLLNRYVQNNDVTTGFLAALRDRRVHRALTLIHQEPEFAWTLETLGERVGMSRATLVRHFQDIVGMAPMAYISDWRIMKAHSLVKHSVIPIEQVADATGFASARTLSRAFQRHYGCSPSELRKSKAL